MPLKPPVSPQARNTIKTAFDELERTITPEDSREFSNTSLEQVIRTCLEIEEQLASRQSLRNMRRLKPFFQGLEHYGKSVDILCNGTPFLPWVWAPITLILRIACEYVEAFEQIIKGYSRIAESLGRFETLSGAFGANLEFQQTLAVFYADILKFHVQAYKCVRRNSWRLLFITSWGRFERRFENILDDMKRHGELVDLQANAHHISEARSTARLMREDIKAWREESLSHLQRLDVRQATKEYESIVTWLKTDESDQLAIQDAISMEGAKFAGTCSWVLKNPKIKSFLQASQDSPVVWLQGAPGSGKSVLTTQIVKFMKAAELFLIQHFCSQRYASSTTYEQILRSLLLQLLRKDDDLVAHVYKDCVLGKRPPTVQALENLLHTLFAIASREPRKTEYIWIVIDGLNECEKGRQASVVNLINKISAKTAAAENTVCKVLISSRTSSIISHRLRMKHIVSLTEEKTSIKLAIRQYVSQRLLPLHEKFKQLSLSRKEIGGIEAVITNKADGMFLYARLVLDYLSSNIFYSGEEMKDSINELPEELSDFYQKILIQILVHLNSQSVERIKTIFGWIAFAKRPLKRMEFLSALTFSAGDPEVKNLVPKYALDLCGALVEERPDTTLAFIHISVKEFLQSPSSNLAITDTEAIVEHTTATLACLQSGLDIFLSSCPERQKVVRVVKGFHGFHVYATEFWTEYLLHLASTGTFCQESSVSGLASRLALNLEKRLENTTAQSRSPETGPLDERLADLVAQPLLQKHVEAALRSRSLKRLESNILQEVRRGPDSEFEPRHELGTTDGDSVTQLSNKSDHPQAEDVISNLLAAYQEVVRFLLDKDHYPGVSAEDLSFFKSQFQNSAFTCRLNFCPRATIGFASEEMCRQHEIAHTQLAQCTIPGCPYPPFVSTKALWNHMNKHHRPRPSWKPIRRVGHISTRQVSEKPSAESDATNLRDSPVELNNMDIETRRFDDATGEDSGKLPSIREMVNNSRRTKATGLTIAVDGSIFEDSFRPEVNCMDNLGSPSSPTDVYEMVPDPPIDLMGFRLCSIDNCGQKICDGISEALHPEMFMHYWNWHHADSMARCSVEWCQMIFSTRERLQAHYKQRHNLMICKYCEIDHAEGFVLEEELRHHWRSEHIRRDQVWICVCPKQSMWQGIQPPVRFDACKSCTGKKKYDRRYDAFKHLRTVHFNSVEDGPGWPSNSQLERFVKEKWMYREVSSGMQKIGERVESIDGEISEDEAETRIQHGDLFYVEELA